MVCKTIDETWNRNTNEFSNQENRNQELNDKLYFE